MKVKWNRMLFEHFLLANLLLPQAAQVCDVFCIILLSLFHVRANIIAPLAKYKSLYGNVTNPLHMPEILNYSE